MGDGSGSCEASSDDRWLVGLKTLGCRLINSLYACPREEGPGVGGGKVFRRDRGGGGRREADQFREAD
jgi:hypothetical protein